MTRVSLKEAYDNKDVIAQIYAIRDTAESAVDTSEQAVTTANTASAHVDALVPQVEGAVANANSASSSAQASAQTVAGYENRLATVEDATEDLAGDLNAVTLRVTTAEGDIVTIQGRVTAIEGNYLKKSGDPQTVVSQINVPTTATGVRDSQIANGTRIQNDLDNYQQMARLNNEQTFSGRNIFLRYIQGVSLGKIVGSVAGTLVGARDGYVEMATIALGTNKGVRFLMTGGANNNNYFEGEYVLNRGGSTPRLYCLKKMYSTGNQKPDLYIDDVDGTVHIYGIRLQYTYQVMIAVAYFDYGNIQQYPANELTPSENIGQVVELPDTAIHEVAITKDA